MVLLLNKVVETINEYNMLQIGDKVIVGVSGGPDSICMLHILMTLRERFSLKLVVAHINHGLRGVDSDNDEKYVEEFCKLNKIDFSSIKVDVHKISRDKNISCESAGRDVRYKFFNSLKEKHSANKIAIAHNSNDQAETVLMRIMRGTGLEGLSGIKPIRDGIIIRPLLYCTRAEIEDYCNINQLDPRIDKTNFENIFARNKVRLELIPYIETNFNNHIVNVLDRLAENSRVDNEFLEQNSEKKYKKYCTNKDDRVIITKEAFQEHQAIISRILRKAFVDLLGDLNSFERVHIFQIIDLQKNRTGKQTMLPNDIIAFNNYGDIHIYIKGKNETVNLINMNVYKLQLGENTLKDFGIKVTINQINEAPEHLDSSENIKYFDATKISNSITLRFRKNGDKFIPLGMSGYKKLKDIFIDMKIPREERNKIPLICFDNDIGWIVGYKVSNSFKIDSTTKKLIQIKLEREEK